MERAFCNLEGIWIHELPAPEQSPINVGQLGFIAEPAPGHSNTLNQFDNDPDNLGFIKLTSGRESERRHHLTLTGFAMYLHGLIGLTPGA